MTPGMDAGSRKKEIPFPLDKNGRITPQVEQFKEQAAEYAANGVRLEALGL